jgi:hypothetical protein
MSKKKKKFKKSLSQKLEEKLTEEKSAVDMDAATKSPVTANKDSLNEAPATDRYQTARRDVTHSLTWIVILLVILIGFTILNSTTDFLTAFGDWLYQLLNLKI